MNRLPIAPPVQIPNKNGFRATPPPPVYDPTTYATAQPRYVYTNGAIPQGTVPYSGQVMFVSKMQLLGRLPVFSMMPFVCSHSSSNNFILD